MGDFWKATLSDGMQKFQKSVPAISRLVWAAMLVRAEYSDVLSFKSQA